MRATAPSFLPPLPAFLSTYHEKNNHFEKLGLKCCMGLCVDRFFLMRNVCKLYSILKCEINVNCINFNMNLGFMNEQWEMWFVFNYCQEWQVGHWGHNKVSSIKRLFLTPFAGQHLAYFGLYISQYLV